MPMPRENAAAKARRLLIEGRLVVTRVDTDVITARIRGDGGEVYRLGYDVSGWHCECAALGRCSHLQALMLVVLVNSGRLA